MSYVWRYYEGSTSSDTVIQDLAKVLCTGVKTEAIKNENGNVVRIPEVVISRNWDIVYPAPDKTSPELQNVMDWAALTPSEFEAKIKNQIENSTDTIILKTKTTEREITGQESTDDLGIENDLATSSIEMYVELYKPKYINDPETYHVECEREGVMPYLVTREIYEEYIKAEITNERDLKEETSGSNPTSNIILSSKTDSGSKLITCDKATIISYANELTSYGLPFSGVASQSFATNGVWSTPDTTIDNEIFKKIINSGTALGQTLNSMYTPTDPNRTYELRIKMNKLSGTAETRMTLSWTRQVEYYTINDGYIYSIPNYDVIKWDSLYLYYSNDASDTSLTNYFTIDKLLGTIKCNKTITICSEVLGAPILAYKSENKNPTIDSKKLIPNRHHIYIRMFDKLNDEGNGPIADLIDEASGEVVQRYSKVSEWSKLSWYQDFEEVSIDELSTGKSDISSGIVNLPLETPGLLGETRFNFWINCNNDRAAIVIMGNPSLDFSSNRHLISAAYLGQIESFDNSINDVAGNFALFTSSSTNPCYSTTSSAKISKEVVTVLGVGDGNSKSYSLDMGDEYFYDTSASNSVSLVDSQGAQTILKENSGYTLNISADKKSVSVEFDSAPANGVTINLNYNNYYNKISQVKGAIRDSLGNVISTTYPQTYGVNTATGVIDVSMLHTRGKAYYQKHHLMFNTTEEYMTKEQYGKSAYTGEYFADKLKITHGNDGPRGMLAEMLAIDTSSLYAFDELIVNRDFSKDKEKDEETYVFFPITAPFSPFSGSPNATYGIAIKKAFSMPVEVDDKRLIEDTKKVLELKVGNLENLTENIYLPTELENGVTISWESSDESLISFK